MMWEKKREAEIRGFFLIETDLCRVLTISRLYAIQLHEGAKSSFCMLRMHFAIKNIWKWWKSEWVLRYSLTKFVFFSQNAPIDKMWSFVWIKRNSNTTILVYIYTYIPWHNHTIIHEFHEILLSFQTKPFYYK